MHFLARGVAVQACGALRRAGARTPERPGALAGRSAARRRGADEGRRALLVLVAGSPRRRRRDACTARVADEARVALGRRAAAAPARAHRRDGRAGRRAAAVVAERAGATQPCAAARLAHGDWRLAGAAGQGAVGALRRAVAALALSARDARGRRRQGPSVEPAGTVLLGEDAASSGLDCRHAGLERRRRETDAGQGERRGAQRVEATLEAGDLGRGGEDVALAGACKDGLEVVVAGVATASSPVSCGLPAARERQAQRAGHRREDQAMVFRHVGAPCSERTAR